MRSPHWVVSTDSLEERRAEFADVEKTADELLEAAREAALEEAGRSSG